MKKTILLITAFLFLVSLSVIPARAESDENITKRRPDRPVQAEIQEVRQESQTLRQEIRSNVAQNHANRLERRFEFYYKRLNNIITRFESRLELLKNGGKNTSAAQLKLDAAKAKLEAAKLKGEEAVAAFKAVDPAKYAEQKTAILAAKDTAVAAKQLFQDAFDLLKLALKELKTISKPALPAASAAVQTTK